MTITLSESDLAAYNARLLKYERECNAWMLATTHQTMVALVTMITELRMHNALWYLPDKFKTKDAMMAEFNRLREETPRPKPPSIIP